MKKNIFSPEQIEKAITFIRDNLHNERLSTKEIVKAAFDFASPGNGPQPKVNSSAISRYLAMAKKPLANNGTLGPVDRIRLAEGQIRDALLQVDAERNRLQERLAELDSVAAKYRQMQ